MALLAAMREAGVRTLVFSSTAATYGEPEQVPITEDAPDAAHQPLRRLQARRRPHDHRRVRRPRAGRGLAAVLQRGRAPTARRASGTTPSRTSSRSSSRSRRAAARRISVYGDDYPTPDGTCVRDYIHVADLAEAHLLALDRRRPGEHLICNLGNGNGFSVREVVETVRQVTGHPIPEVVAPRRGGDPAVLVASADTRPRAAGLEPVPRGPRGHRRGRLGVRPAASPTARRGSGNGGTAGPGRLRRAVRRASPRASGPRPAASTSSASTPTTTTAS